MPVADLTELKLKSYEWLRFAVPLADSVDERSLLTATYDGPLPLRATVDKKGPIGDLVGTGWPNLYLISDRFKQLLEKESITGWYPYPVSHDLGSETHFWLMGAIGRCGPAYGTGGPQRLGLDPLGQFLDPEEWDGSDIFVPANLNVTLVVPHAAMVVETAQLANVDLVPAGLEPTPAP